ncbi:MAG: hypothetical protein R3F39_18425 [Myxococcota bacterium]
MRWFGLTVAAMVALGTGCAKEQPAPSAGARGSEAGAAAGAGQALPAPAGAPRRERAGIETGASGVEPEVPTGERPPAAKLIDRNVEQVPPPADNPNAADLRAAWSLVAGPWLSALEAGDAAAFTALLDERFIGSTAPGIGEAPGRDAWAAARKPPVAGVSSVSVGSVEARFDAGPSLTVYFRFQERAAAGAECLETRRELVVQRPLEGEGGAAPVWRLVGESALDSGACELTSAPTFAAAHEDLKKALLGRDEDRAREKMAPFVWLRDDGVQTATYSAGDVWAEGHWVAAALAKVMADADSTRATSTVGVVSGPDAAFVYESRPAGPVLVGVERGGVGRVSARAAAPAPAQEPAPAPATEPPPAP